jgi:hypothetical protein
MNRKSLITLAVAAFTAGAALADDITIDTTPFTPTATRAQVQSELAAFRASGVNPWSRQYNPLAQFRHQRTRAEVVAEYLSERQRVAALTGEDSGSAYIAAHRIPRAFETLAGEPVRAH